MVQGAERRLQAAVAARLDAIPWAHRSGPYQALDLRFGVRTCDPALGEYLATLFAAFATGGDAGERMSWLSALERGCGRGRRLLAYVGGRRLVATTSPPLVLAYLLWALNREVVARARGTILLHAAAAERDGAMVVLPAGPGSGKTTLVAGLLCRGYRYVTDEIVAVDIASGAVRIFPKALSLEPGSWRLLPELAADPPQPPNAYASDRRHVTASHLGAEIASGEATPRVLLSPRYRDGARTELTRLRPAASLVLLAENSFNARDWGQAGLDGAAAIVRACPVLAKLDVGDLSSACDAVDDAVDEALTASRSTGAQG